MYVCVDMVSVCVLYNECALANKQPSIVNTIASLHLSLRGLHLTAEVTRLLSCPDHARRSRGLATRLAWVKYLDCGSKQMKLSMKTCHSNMEYRLSWVPLLACIRLLRAIPSDILSPVLAGGSVVGGQDPCPKGD